MLETAHLLGVGLSIGRLALLALRVFLRGGRKPMVCKWTE
jgi:hypothetical protein